MQLFEPGQIRVTGCVSDLMAEDPDFERIAMASLHRHLAGDWGEISEDDRDMNNAAMVNGDRILSVYLAPCAEGRVYILTDYDRESTTMLFPSEY